MFQGRKKNNIQVRNEGSESMFLKKGQFEGVCLWATLGEFGLERRQAHRQSLTQGLDSHQAEECLHSGVLSDNSLLRRKGCQMVRPSLEGTQIHGPGGLTWSPLHCLSCSVMDVWMRGACKQTWMRAMFGRDLWRRGSPYLTTSYTARHWGKFHLAVEGKLPCLAPLSPL